MKIKYKLMLGFIIWTLALSLAFSIGQNSAFENRLSGFFIEDTDIAQKESINLFVFVAFSIIISTIISTLIANSITKPLNEISEQLNLLKSGGKVEKINVSGSGEISELGKSFNEAVKTVNSLSESNLKVQRELHIYKKVKEALK